MRKERYLSVQYVLIFLVAFGSIYLLNRITVFTSDDFLYHYFYESNLPSENTRLLAGIWELPQSLWNHYQEVNGRMVSHAFVQFFMLFDKSVFNICNSLAYLLLGVLLMCHIQPSVKKWRPLQFGFLYLMMFLFLPSFGATVLWVSGSCNYMWMCIVQLAFLLPYRFYTEKGENKYPFLSFVWVIFTGVLAGCSNENSGGAVGCLTLLYLLFWILKKKRVPGWGVAGLVSVMAGYLVILLSPATATHIEGSWMNVPVLLKRLREFVGFSYHYLLIPVVIFLIVIWIVIKYKKRSGREWIPCMELPIIYCIAGLASVIVLIASHIIAGRSWIWAVCYFMIAIGQLLWILFEDGYCMKKWMKIAIGMISCYSFVWYAVAFSDINRTYQERNHQIQMIEEQREKGIMEVKIPLLTATGNAHNAISVTADLDDDKNSWFNQWMAVYYDVNSITGETE